MGYSVELQAPDITTYRQGNTGVEYIHRFTAAKPGPHVMISAIVHGNEICGAIALDFLLRHSIRPDRGTLTLCFANWRAYSLFDPTRPHLSRYVDEDMNRVWSQDRLEHGPNSRELARAREIRPFVTEADILLDLHSMSDDCQPLALAGRAQKGIRLARSVGLAPFIVMDKGHAAGRRMRDYQPFSDPRAPQAALLMECGQHWRRNTAEFAINTCLRLLLSTGLAGVDQLKPWLTLLPAHYERLLDVTHTVTVENDAFYFTRSVQAMERIAHAGTELGLDGRQPVVTPYDNCFLVMPQPGAPKGNTAVRMARAVS